MACPVNAKECSLINHAQFNPFVNPTKCLFANLACNFINRLSVCIISCNF